MQKSGRTERRMERRTFWEYSSTEVENIYKAPLQTLRSGHLCWETVRTRNKNKNNWLKWCTLQFSLYITSLNWKNERSIPEGNCVAGDLWVAGNAYSFGEHLVPRRWWWTFGTGALVHFISHPRPTLWKPSIKSHSLQYNGEYSGQKP